ncbi:hypothetical protein SAMN05446589_7381 [Streptomyces sp. OV198]|jgi:hypothetical protein|uniref:hypothetical protein n=1 Tax=Streptomyces sp. OV198 TaxID=1882787 RepID=UPI000BC99415|nr:hypothetical protein [Streptomyces sp. OV198]SOE77643.1 hypothetical protein SAMN05446589_7381 [Streptomyces sp. OV198]
MRLVDVEIGRYDWSAFECGCTKSVAHLADDLQRLAEAQSIEQARALQTARLSDRLNLRTDR